MKIIAMASSKGGTGKSCLSVSVATEAVRMGSSVFLLDLDPQQSTAAWWRRAGGPDNPMLAVGVPLASEAIRMLDRHAVDPDYLIIDLPGSLVHVIEDAVRVADAVAVISQPSPKDLEGQGALEGMIDKLGQRPSTLYILNRVDNRSKLVFEAQMLLAGRSTRLPMTVTETVAFVRADAEGRTASEINKIAAAEIGAIWQALKGIAHDHRKDAARSFAEPNGQSAGAQPEGSRIARTGRLAKQGA